MSRAIVVTEFGLDARTLVDLARSIADEVEVVVFVAPGTSPMIELGADLTTGLVNDDLKVAESVAAVLADWVEGRGAEIIVLPATPRFREVAPLLTSRLEAACAPDVIAANRTDGVLTVDRLLYGGIAIATLQLQRARVVLTAAVSFRVTDEGAAAPVQTVDHIVLPGKELVSQRQIKQDGDLSSADRIVAFGRGVRSREDIHLIERLAIALNATIGCSRPIVEDLGWLSLPHQIGLTGTTVHPELYLAVGISGQIQHLVGMRDSKLIIAINTNEAAPIFEAADLAVVGDLYEILPRLVDAIVARSA